MITIDLQKEKFELSQIFDSARTEPDPVNSVPDLWLSAR